jgi:1-deoxy-D-xylulose-5-phosphate reductoisomerase
MAMKSVNAPSSPPGTPRTVTVLGSTGSVGTQTIELLLADPDSFRVRALVAGRNAMLLAEQAIALGAECAVVADLSVYPVLRDALAGTGIQVAAGPDAVVQAAAMEADWTMAAITGAAGLAPTLAAIKRGAYVGLANKEALVSAGDMMLRAVRQAGATLLPVDSEHNAIFQSLADGNRGAVEKIVLTASGGPFRNSSLDVWRNRKRRCGTRFGRWAPKSASIPRP